MYSVGIQKSGITEAKESRGPETIGEATSCFILTRTMYAYYYKNYVGLLQGIEYIKITKGYSNQYMK